MTSTPARSLGERSRCTASPSSAPAASGKSSCTRYLLHSVIQCRQALHQMEGRPLPSLLREQRRKSLCFPVDLASRCPLRTLPYDPPLGSPRRSAPRRYACLAPLGRSRSGG